MIQQRKRSSDAFPLFVPLLFAFLVVVFLAPVILYAGDGKEAPVQWIDLTELKAVVQEKNPLIIDLRTPGEFANGHLPGAVNVPIEALFERQDVLDLHRKKTLLLYCRTVNKTDYAIHLLKKRGFAFIYALQGGYEAYRVHPILQDPPVVFETGS